MSDVGYRITINETIRERARDLYRLHRKDRDASMTYLGDESMVAGAFGEAAFEAACQICAVPVPRYVGAEAYSHDYEGNGWPRVEVKTKPRSVHPRAEYQAGVPTESLRYQKPDLWVFVSLYPKASRQDGWSYESAFVVGTMTGDEFLERSRLVPKGTPMGSGAPSYEEMRVVDLGELRPFTDITPMIGRQG